MYNSFASVYRLYKQEHGKLEWRKGKREKKGKKTTLFMWSLNIFQFLFLLFNSVSKWDSVFGVFFPTKFIIYILYLNLLNTYNFNSLLDLYVLSAFMRYTKPIQRKAFVNGKHSFCENIYIYFFLSFIFIPFSLPFFFLLVLLLQLIFINEIDLKIERIMIIVWK